MWDSNSSSPCPCPSPSGASKNIPVVRIKVPELDEDLEKLNKVGKEYTEPTSPVAEKAEESSNTFLGPYTPMPYIFRLGCGPPCPGQHARSPPLWLLIDHTLAVIWSLFAQKKCTQLGVSQLQWALTFLRTIKDESGKYPPDVQLCIDAIENHLFSQFANLRDEKGCGLPICAQCHENIQPDKDGSKVKEPLTPINEESAVNYTGGGIQRKTVCPAKEKSVPLSVTINSMLKSHSTSVHQLFKAGSSTINRISDEGFSLTRTDATTSGDEVMDDADQSKAHQ